jgi:hypothetical protein
MTAVAASKMVRRISLLDGGNYRGILVICDLVEVAAWQFITYKQTHETFLFSNMPCEHQIPFKGRFV